MGTINPYVSHGLPVSGTTAQLPANASTGQFYWDGTTLYVYDDVTGWNLFNPVASGATTSGQTGIGYTQYIDLMTGRTAAGAALPTTAASNNLAVSSTVGTSLHLIGEAVQNTTIADSAIYEVTLPRSYAAGTNLTVTVNAQYNVSGGTTPTCTVVAAAYLCANAGTQGSNLIATAAKSITTSAADYMFIITGIVLTAGSRILIEVTTSIKEAGNTGTFTGQVNSLRWS
ncbi:MAG: hypothetical protein KGL39_42485 [Patescibacteria group bacterium]|nr:hypothetical protein [Patescibacteria group bacterium]